MIITKNDRSNRDLSTGTTGVDNAEHRNGPDSRYARLERPNVEIAKRRDTTRKYADSLREHSTLIKHHHQLKKITGITTGYTA